VGVLPKVDPTVGAGVTSLQVKDYKERRVTRYLVKLLYNKE
jgi:hypothetical protein